MFCLNFSKKSSKKPTNNTTLQKEVDLDDLDGVRVDWDIEDKKYRKMRQKLYQDVVTNLNTSHFIDRPFTVQLG
jgi:hypothetical protein